MFGKQLFTFIILFCFIIATGLFGQDITVTPHATVKADTLGAEIVFDIDVQNNTAGDLAVYVVRTRNDIPTNWQTALCFELCFASFVDSIATTPDFGSTPLTAGATRRIQVHVFASNSDAGTAYIGLKIGSLRTPLQYVEVNLQATAPVTGIEEESGQAVINSVSHAFPNPFGSREQSTNLKVTLADSQPVNVSIYNLTGEKLAELSDGIMNHGTHLISFDGKNIPSGTYIYRAVVGSKVFSGKLQLIK